MAYDPQVSPDSEVFFQNRFNIRINLKHLGKIVEAEDLEAADKAEQNANQKEDNRSIKPGAQLQDASNCIAQDHAAQKRNASSARSIPPYLVGTFGAQTGQHEDE